MEKMNMKAQVTTRKELYDIVIKALGAEGYSTEPIKGGILIDLGEGYYAKAAISICDPEKVGAWRHEYAEQMEKNAQKAAARAEKEREKAEKAKARAEKKNKKEEKLVIGETPYEVHSPEFGEETGALTNDF